MFEKTNRLFKLDATQLFVISVLLFGQFIFGAFFNKSNFLDPEYFYADSIIITLFGEAISTNTLLFGCFALCLTILILALIIKCRWSQIVNPPLRIFITMVAFILVWRHATYEYNYIYDQAHHIDRLIVIGLFLLSVWRPVFIIFIPVVSFIIQSQFLVDIGSYSTTLVITEVKILFVFSLYLILTVLFRKKYVQALTWVIVVVVLSQYWQSAFAKYSIEWHKYGELHNFMAASYSGGWLSFISVESISTVIRYIESLKPFPMMLTLIFESMVIFALWNYRFLVFFFCSAILFHIAVVMQSGIFFWNWILIDVTLVLVILRLNQTNRMSIISTKPIILLVSTVLIGSSHLWPGANNLGWHDSPVSNNFYIDVIDDQGKLQTLLPSYFSPFAYTFTLGSFRYLVEKPILPVSWGASRDLTMVQNLTDSHSINSLNGVIAKYSTIQFNEKAAHKFDRFISRYLQIKQLRSENTFWFDYFPAPLNLYTGSQKREPVNLNIREIRVRLYTTWFNGTNFVVLNDEVVRTIKNQ